MKNLLVICILFIGNYLFAQFPAAFDLDYQLEYLEIGQSGECDGEYVTGPHHCSYFEWRMPDTSLTDAKLDHFEIYNKNDNDSTLITSTNDTTYVMSGGFENNLYVIAVYTSPAGYSNPSNIVTSEGLPISVESISFSSNPIIYHRSSDNNLFISSTKEVTRISIYDLNGRLVVTQKKPNNRKSLATVPEGIYIVKIKSDDKVIQEKLFIY